MTVKPKLKSTNEELQSLNEKLHIANAQLQEKNTQLIELNSDIENLMKNINIGTIFLDKNFHVRKYTPAINEHFQLSSKDIGRSIALFHGIMGGKDIITYSKEVIKNLKPFKKEVRNTKGDWFLMQIFPYRNQEDTIEGVVLNFIDINDLRNAINEKEKLNSFLTHLTDSTPANIYIYDVIKKQNTYVSNSNIWEIAGYNKNDVQKLSNKLLDKIIHPDDLEKVKTHLQNLKNLKNDQILQLEYRVIHKKTKNIIWLLSSDKVNTRDKKGDVSTILGLTQNVSELKDIELQLKESEERFRLAIVGTQSGMWEWSDLIKDEAWYSNEFCELLGYTNAEMKNSYSQFVKLIHPNHIKTFREGLDKHVKNSVPFDEQVQIKTKNEGYKWFVVNGQMQYDHNSKSIKKIVGTLLDINQKKKSESKMKQLNVELERFAYLASHDLKEPLRTVTSFTKLFKDEYADKFDDDAHQYINFIESASSRMITLTNDLLTYSQLDDKSLNFEKVNLNTVLKNVKDNLQSSINTSKAIIHSNILPDIVCDSIQIEQLFQNLLSNSIKYRTDKAPEIEISCKIKSNEFEFSIKDNGIGIPKKHREEVFEVFKRLHNQSEYEGTGIGLANCKRIVNNHKGEISVNSNYIDGAMFLFTIPKIKL